MINYNKAGWIISYNACNGVFYSREMESISIQFDVSKNKQPTWRF